MKSGPFTRNEIQNQIKCDQKKQIGRIRLQVILDYSAYSLETFITENIQRGSNIVTDSWSSYSSIVKEQYHHVLTNPSKAGKDHDSLYGVHLVASLVKRLIRGTFQGRFEPKYLQNYLDEYVFRFNRRKSKNNRYNKESNLADRSSNTFAAN